MKKLLAVLLALTMLSVFAACGAKEEAETTEPEVTEATEATEATEEATEATEEATEATEEATEATEEATEATEESKAEESKEDASETKKDETKKEETTKKDESGLNSTNIKEVIAYYNAAQAKTKKAGAPKGHQTMKLDGDITGDGALGAALKVAMPIIKSTLEKNSTETDYIPGDADNSDIKESDVVSAKATSANGVTTIEIKLKEQTDGPQADAHTAGPVARGIGTLGNVDTAIESLGAEVYSGKETISLKYNDAYLKCTVDEKTGTITGGTWHYKVNVNVVAAELKLGIKINVKNLKACIDYTVAI